jgi:AmmeMemoRadiSam system protein B
MEHIRPPAVDGFFYPAEAEALGALIDDCLVTSPLGPQAVTPYSQSLIGGMVPHAGYVYSGPCAAHLYARLAGSVQRVIVLGVNHRAEGHNAALSPWDYWQTPLGKVPVDQELNESLRRRVPFLKRDELAHSREHSIEVELPFLQRVLHDFTFLPISLSYLSVDACAELGWALAEICLSQADKPIVLASTDLSHYRSPRDTEELDQIALEKVLGRQPEDLLKVVEEKNITMCGVIPAAVALFAVNALGATRAQLLKHCHSGDAAPMKEVVGYASVVFEV